MPTNAHSAHCPHCRGPLVSIELCVSGTDLEMRSCSNCDRRWWRADGRNVQLATLLGREPVRQPALR